MNEHQLVRDLLARIGMRFAGSPLRMAALAGWALQHGEWLCGRKFEEGDPFDLAEALAAAESGPGAGDAVPQVLLLARELADLLALEPFDRALLELMIGCERLSRACWLLRLAGDAGLDVPALLGEMAGAEPDHAERLVRRSRVLRLGLFGFASSHNGSTTIAMRWALQRVLDRMPGSGPELVEALVGSRRPPQLDLGDFAHVPDAEFLARLLGGTLDGEAAGINLLVHGPPGMGKTELAHALAAAAGADLFAVGECDPDEEEPSRWDRVCALQLAQGVLGGRGRHVLLFDEMEDLLGDARREAGGAFGNRAGSKVFINRLLETNPVPVIWTTNRIDNIDHAIARRMSFILHLEPPSRQASQRILARIATSEGAEAGAGLAALVDARPDATSVARVAVRAAGLSGDPEDGLRVARSLVTAMHGEECSLERSDRLDLSLFEADRSISALFESIRTCGVADVSLLLSGPPGTGKTALAHHLARNLDRPLMVKRASDLLSKWVGGTERLIAQAFAEARRSEAVLLFDEADSLLFDRSGARQSWEVGQVNEFLTWLDGHPFPVVAATNHPGQLDPAMMRRFDFKLALRPLGPELAAQAFTRFFSLPAPPALAQLRGLTPGDFAVVKRQLRLGGVSDAGEIVQRLADECALKPGASGRIGF